jgi:thioredoxin reductase (NADPH)
MSDSTGYDVAVIGGGPAGLTAALYTTRLGHDTVVLNRGGGRAAMMRDTHNVIGVTEETSGNEFLQTAIEQLESYGTDYRQTFVTAAERVDDDREFRLETNDADFFADRVVLATGFSDTHPDPPLPRTGRGLHYCLHCDAYMFVDEPVYVMGHGESAAHVAMIMLNFTDDVDLLLRGEEPGWSDETDRQLRAHPVDIIEGDVASKFSDDEDPEWLGGFEFENGERREYTGGFGMYGSEYNNGLADELGCEVNDDGTIEVDDHGNTSVEGVYAVGDLVPGHNQIPVAMGQGAKAGIDIHYDLRRFPMSLEELEAAGDISADDVPAVSEALRERSASGAADD